MSVSAKTVFSDGAQIPFESYAYWETENSVNAVYTKPMYSEPLIIDAERLKIEEFSQITDVSVSEQGNVFVLDSENSRVVILGNDYKFIKELIFSDEYAFKGAKGIYVRKERIYIADTENKRVIIFDMNGSFIDEITLPDSSVIPEDFIFRPLKLAVDGDGYTYVLSDGSYYGAILFSPSGEFLSFFGANAVKVGITQAISNFWNKLTMTNEKKASQISKLPFQITDMYVDNENFIYTATGKTKEGELQNGVIRRLSPSGSNIIPSDDITFGEKELSVNDDPDFKIGAQNIAGLAVNRNGFFCVYDTTYSKIYVYDCECNMFCALGAGMNTGIQQGTFKNISGIDVLNNDIIVTDSIKNTITVFKCTEYGEEVMRLQRLTLDGDYTNAQDGWKKINALDANNRFAYIGLAKAAYSGGEYERAMELAKIAYDRDTYSQAFQQVRKANLRENFLFIFIVVVAVIGFIFFLLFAKKKKNRDIKNIKAHLFFTASIHPVNSFTEIKSKSLCSVGFGIAALLAFYLSVAIQQMFGSFVFVNASNTSFNSVVLFLRTVGLVLLWTITNWGVCTLMGGIGKLKEIFTVVTYSLMPMIIGNVIYTAITHLLVPSEAAFMTVITLILQMYTVFMIAVGTIIIHDFSFGRFIGTTVLTFFGMAIVLVVGVLLVILFQQFTAFLSTVFNELIYK